MSWTISWECDIWYWGQQFTRLATNLFKSAIYFVSYQSSLLWYTCWVKRNPLLITITFYDDACGLTNHKVQWKYKTLFNFIFSLLMVAFGIWSSLGSIFFPSNSKDNSLNSEDNRSVIGSHADMSTISRTRISWNPQKVVVVIVRRNIFYWGSIHFEDAFFFEFFSPYAPGLIWRL